MDNVVNVSLNVPQSDVRFLSELVKKMGWGMTQSETQPMVTVNRAQLIQRLYGCVQLSDDFDYKRELEEALSEKYRV